MQEKDFWLVLTAIIVVLSAICIFMVGFTYFVVIPRPIISTSTSFALATSTPTELPNYTSEVANVYPTLSVLTPSAHPSFTSSPAAFPPEDTPSLTTPEAFIRSYYALINQREYTTTFEMLSPGFKDRRHCCNPDGSYQFEPYADWWDSVARVQVTSVETTRWEERSARVVIQLRYTKKNGRIVDSTHTFDLVMEPLSGNWLID